MNKHILNYWIQSLSDSIKMGIKTTETNHVKAEINEFYDGCLHEKHLNNVINHFTEKKTTKKRQDEKENEMKVIIAPIIFKPKYNYNYEKRFIYPIFVPAIVKEDGTLTPNPNLQPWIPRELLEPNNVGRAFSQGELSEYNDFLTKYGVLKTGDWSKTIQYVEHLFEAVFKISFRNTKEHHSYIIDNEIRIFFEDRITGAAETILNLYQYIQKTNPNIPLFNSYSQVTQRALEDIDMNPLQLSKKHYGQMSDEFPLSPSQRESIHAHSLTNEGELLAVNGPPGTGKTTLLQSIISSKFVEHVILDKEIPPVIVASSTNNQAVTNIIDSFGSTEETKGTTLKEKLAGRWLPGIQSYGLYCPSNTKYKSLQGITSIHMMNSNWEGFTKDFENRKKLAEKELFFLSKYNSFTNEKEDDLEQAAANLKSNVKNIIRNMHLLLDTNYQYEWKIKKLKEHIAKIKHFKEDDNSNSKGWFQRLLSYVSNVHYMRNTKKLRRLEEKKHHKLISLNHFSDHFDPNRETLMEYLDKNHRFVAFKYAVHYWEALWLINMKKKEKENAEPNESKTSLKTNWRNIAHLFPCFVSTLYSVPRYFSIGNRENIEPLFNFIDLLIIDEAGQVSPEVGGAAFSLAKKALVVGDEVQIEPVWSIPKEIDKANMIIHDLGNETNIDEKYNVYVENGISVSGSSVIKVAQKVSRFSNSKNVRGMFLSEHRRCVDEIISYCNEIAYHGDLKPMRKKERKNHDLPYLGYAHVPGTSSRLGGSRINEMEADVIAQWVHTNAQQLTAVSGKSIEKTIGIITPFSRQKEVIMKRLKVYNPELNKITVGTVHALQGAERDIIIFSSVYGDNDLNSPYFFDAGVNMLNVALSRAKDTFIVFGNMEIFKMDGNKPSNVLAHFLFSKDTNEISNVVIPERIKYRSSVYEHLNTHEGHDHLLKQCLKTAKKEVGITSPYIRMAAMEESLLRSIHEAVMRGVNVKVFASTEFNYNEDKLINVSKRGVEALRNVGAEVTFLNQVHNKTLWKDRDLICEGSFNWLSAVRDVTNRYHNYEASIIYSGEDVRVMIEETLKKLNRSNGKSQDKRNKSNITLESVT